MKTFRGWDLVIWIQCKILKKTSPIWREIGNCNSRNFMLWKKRCKEMQYPTPEHTIIASVAQV